MQASAPRSAISLRPCPVRMSEWREFSKGADSCMLFPGWLRGFGRMLAASSSVERRGLKMTPNKCYTAHRNVHEVGSRRDTQWQFFTEQKVENSDKQNHIKSRSGLPIPVLVAPGNVKRWPRLRPFEFAFCLSLNYSYQKYNSVSCTHTHMYTGGQWCNIKFIKYRRIQRFRKILITPAPECYVATVVVAFLPKFPWSLQASRCYQLLKNWNPAPKLEHLVQKHTGSSTKYPPQYLNTIDMKSMKTSQSSKGKGEKKTRKHAVRVPHISHSQFHQGPKLFGFLPGLPQDTKSRTVGTATLNVRNV